MNRASQGAFFGHGSPVAGDSVTLTVQSWAGDGFASGDAQLYLREGDDWRIACANREIEATAH